MNHSSLPSIPGTPTTYPMSEYIPDPTAVADFIYKTANSQIKYLARTHGNQAYINSLNSKKNIPEWKTKFESLMEQYDGNKFNFEQLKQMCTNNGEMFQERYREMSLALYYSLEPHY